MPHKPESPGNDIFDPFKCRICRNVRNSLAHALMEAIEAEMVSPVMDVSEKLLKKNPHVKIESYIKNRITRYRIVLSKVPTAKKDPYSIYSVAAVLWDQKLFFEVHEWLEHFWIKSRGAEKQLLQALIRAAGSHAHLEAGRLDGAKKMAAKAVPVIIEHKAMIPDSFDIRNLTESLKNI